MDSLFAAIPLPPGKISFNTTSSTLEGAAQEQPKPSTETDGDEAVRSQEPKLTRAQRKQRTPDEMVFEALLLHSGSKAAARSKAHAKGSRKGKIETIALQPPRGASGDQILQYLQKNYPSTKPEVWLATRLEYLLAGGVIRNENVDLPNVRAVFQMTPKTYESVLQYCQQKVGDVSIANKNDARRLVAAAAGARSRGKKRAGKLKKDAFTRVKQGLKKLRKVERKIDAKKSQRARRARKS